MSYCLIIDFVVIVAQVAPLAHLVVPQEFGGGLVVSLESGECTWRGDSSTERKSMMRRWGHVISRSIDTETGDCECELNISFRLRCVDYTQ